MQFDAINSAQKILFKQSSLCIYVYARYELQVLNWMNLQVLDSSDLFAIW